MNDTIVKNINSVVKPKDTLYVLGDWSFGGFHNVAKLRHQLLVETIHLILGNHDTHIKNNRDNIQQIFTSVQPYLEIKHNDYNFVLFHYPILSWNGIGKGYIHLYGHQHSLPDDRFGVGKCMDIGLEGHPKFRPYSVEEIISLMNKRQIKFHSKDLDDHSHNK